MSEGDLWRFVLELAARNRPGREIEELASELTEKESPWFDEEARSWLDAHDLDHPETAGVLIRRKRRRAEVLIERERKKPAQEATDGLWGEYAQKDMQRQIAGAQQRADAADRRAEAAEKSKNDAERSLVTAAVNVKEARSEAEALRGEKATLERDLAACRAQLDEMTRRFREEAGKRGKLERKELQSSESILPHWLGMTRLVTDRINSLNVEAQARQDMRPETKQWFVSRLNQLREICTLNYGAEM